MLLNAISLSQERNHEPMWAKIDDDQIWEARTVRGTLMQI